MPQSSSIASKATRERVTEPLDCRHAPHLGRRQSTGELRSYENSIPPKDSSDVTRSVSLLDVYR